MSRESPFYPPYKCFSPPFLLLLFASWYQSYGLRHIYSTWVEPRIPIDTSFIYILLLPPLPLVMLTASCVTSDYSSLDTPIIQKLESLSDSTTTKSIPSSSSGIMLDSLWFKNGGREFGAIFPAKDPSPMSRARKCSDNRCGEGGGEKFDTRPTG